MQGIEAVYRLHRHEGAIGIVDCAINEAGDDAADQKKYVSMRGVYLDGEVLFQSVNGFGFGIWRR